VLVEPPALLSNTLMARKPRLALLAAGALWLGRAMPGMAQIGSAPPPVAGQSKTEIAHKVQNPLAAAYAGELPVLRRRG
jgi:hypothetical protein